MHRIKKAARKSIQNSTKRFYLCTIKICFYSDERNQLAGHQHGRFLGRKKTILFNFCPFNLPACVLKHWKLAKTEKRLLCQSLDETENTFCTFVHPGSCQEKKRKMVTAKGASCRGWSVNPCDLKKRQGLDNRLGSIFFSNA